HSDGRAVRRGICSAMQTGNEGGRVRGGPAVGHSVANAPPGTAAATRMPDMWVRRRQQPRATLTRDDSRSRVVRPAARPPAGGFISWGALAPLTGGAGGSLGAAAAPAGFRLFPVVFCFPPPGGFFLAVKPCAPR